MKKPINEIAKLKRLAGLITESEYQEEVTNEYHQNAINIEKVKEAKTLVSKDKKIQVIKEWIWYTCDEGQMKDDINKYNKMVDMYFTDKDDVTKEDFKKIWAKVTEKYGVGDIGADWEAFPETWNDVQKGNLVDPGVTYEGKEKVEEISDAAKDIMGDLEGGAFERMNSLVNRNHILSLLAAAEGIMGDLEADGFEVEDIRAYINQIIVNDI
jgi:hypothetical protein